MKARRAALQLSAVSAASAPVSAANSAASASSWSSISPLQIGSRALVQGEEAAGEHGGGDEQDRRDQAPAKALRAAAYRHAGATSRKPAERTVSIGPATPSTVSLRRR